MNLIVNGQKTAVDVRRLDELLSILEFLGGDHIFAVAVNQTCVRRSQYDQTILNDGDEIEILTPMAGG